MFGLFFAQVRPDNYRAWKTSNYSFYDALAHHLHDLNIIVEPDSREPWFMCEAHGLDPSCLTDTLKALEAAVDLVLEHGTAAT
jgi:glutamate-1-semialdehyde 2,1-aminomutase